jgi:hypothetical protein
MRVFVLTATYELRVIIEKTTYVTTQAEIRQFTDRPESYIQYIELLPFSLTKLVADRNLVNMDWQGSYI